MHQSDWFTRKSQCTDKLIVITQHKDIAKIVAMFVDRAFLGKSLKFEREITITLTQTLSKFMLNSKIIFKIIVKPDDSSKGLQE